MSPLIPDYTSSFQRDIKSLKRKHRDTTVLLEVIRLILENTPASHDELRRRHNAHTLKGSWAGSNECHVANVGDWLLVWRTGNGIAVFHARAVTTTSFDEKFVTGRCTLS